MLLYKLIDETQKNDIENNKRITLSRPIFEFGNPEGLVFDFFRDIKNLDEDVCNSRLIKPNEKCLNKIQKWIEDYKKTINSTLYTEDDIISDFRIQTCVYLQTYFGYFTDVNLFDKNALTEYLNCNRQFVNRMKKKYVLQIEININNSFSLWEIKKDSICSDCDFTNNEDAIEFNDNIRAVLHCSSMVYCDNTLNAEKILELFNTSDNRSFSAFYKYSKEYLKVQGETRLSLYLPSFKYNSSICACELLFDVSNCSSLNEKLFYYALSTYIYIKSNFDRYVFLSIDNYQIKSI